MFVISIMYYGNECNHMLLYYHAFLTNNHSTVWSSELDTLLMRYEVNLTPYRIKSVSNSLDQTVEIQTKRFNGQERRFKAKVTAVARLYSMKNLLLFIIVSIL